MFKVLIVEDVIYIRRGLIMTTPWTDYDCVVAGEASNGVEALQLIEKIHPDIVITDIRMEEMDGLELIQNAKAISECEYIIISGYDDFKYAQKAVALGVNGYLLKPIDDDELHSVLYEACENVKKRIKYMQMSQQLSASLEVRSAVGEDLVYFGMKNKYLDKAIQIMRDRCCEDLGIKTVADELYISSSYLAKLFKNHTNYTFLDALTIFRIRKSIKLLEDDEFKIYEIAQAVGYKDARYFSDVFRKFMGVTPTEYRYGK